MKKRRIETVLMAAMLLIVNGVIVLWLQGHPLATAWASELSERSGLVIATGGGALIPEANLRVLEGSGLVICLDCEPSVLWQRIGHSENRPMLAARDATARW